MDAHLDAIGWVLSPHPQVSLKEAKVKEPGDSAMGLRG